MRLEAEITRAQAVQSVRLDRARAIAETVRMHLPVNQDAAFRIWKAAEEDREIAVMNIIENRRSHVSN